MTSIISDQQGMSAEDPFMKGFNAFQQEFSEHRLVPCPFQTGSKHHQAWLSGYQACDKQIQQDMA